VRRVRCLLVGGKSRLVYLAGSATAYNKEGCRLRAFGPPLQTLRLVTPRAAARARAKAWVRQRLDVRRKKRVLANQMGFLLCTQSECEG